MPFKIGDTVVCIDDRRWVNADDNSTTKHPILIAGAQYGVVSVYDGSPERVDVTDGASTCANLLTQRFKLVPACMTVNELAEFL